MVQRGFRTAQLPATDNASLQGGADSRDAGRDRHARQRSGRRWCPWACRGRDRETPADVGQCLFAPGDVVEAEPRAALDRGCRLAWVMGRRTPAPRGLPRAAAAQKATRARPNVVFILTDNQGAWTLGCYGNRDIRTPNIDRLAQRGRALHALSQLERGLLAHPRDIPDRADPVAARRPPLPGAGGAQWTGAYCTIGEFRTLPQILAEQDTFAG